MKRFKIVHQLDLMQCGASCIAMICQFYGKHIELHEAESLCTPGKRGVSLQAIKEAAEKLGFNTRAMRCSLEALEKNVKLPCILFWENKHFVVLYKINGKRETYFIADPARGRKVYSSKDFLLSWGAKMRNGLGLALEIFPGESFIKNEVSLTTHKQTQLIRGFFTGFGKYLLIVALCLVLCCIIQLAMPVLTQNIVDVGIKHRQIHFIWLLLLGELSLVVGRTVTEFIRSWILTHISTRVNVSLVSSFFTKLLKLPMAFFETKHMGDLTQRMGDHTRVQSFLTKQIVAIIFTIISFIVYGIALAIYDTIIFGVFLGFTLIYSAWITIFLSKRKEIDLDYFEKACENHNITYEFLTTLQETKLQDCCTRRKGIWEKIQAKLFLLQLRSLKLQQIQEAGSTLLNESKNIVITVLSATAVIEGNLTIGAMLAIQYIIGQLYSPVMQLVNFILAYQDMKLSIDRINEIYSRPNENCNNALPLPREESNLGININKLYFRYYGMASDKYILSDVSFEIEPGKVTAIVGHSGCGKTSLIKILLGFYEYEGSITIGGVELRDIDKELWRKKCGVVMQNGAIFSESIGRNIAITDGPINIERLEFASKMACIYDFIQSLPNKYDTVIGNCGIGISSGQKQRILIARAIYRSPQFIILDEATNSLDTSNEKIIVENLKQFYKDKTVLIVAHRLSTIKEADKIIVLENGRIVEVGTHQVLLERKQQYFNLVKNQI